MNSEQFETKRNMALDYQTEGFYDKALRIYDDLLKENPDDPIMLVNYGQALNVTKDYDKAIQVLTKVIKLAEIEKMEPQILSMAHTNLGAVNKGLSNLDEALKHYTLAIEIDAHNQLAKKYLTRLTQDIPTGYKLKPMLDTSKHVFISYMREDRSSVEKIKNCLERLGAKVWFDQDSLYPGSRWREEIQKGIDGGAFFIACFSNNFQSRKNTYMREELELAIKQMKSKPHNRSWFIPIKLTKCDIPNFSLENGEHLSDIQYIDFSIEFEKGLEKLTDTIVPQFNYSLYPIRRFEKIINYHINQKILHFSQFGSPDIFRLADVWRKLLQREYLNIISQDFFTLYNRAKYIKVPQHNRGSFPADIGGHVFFISVIPSQNIATFLNSLPVDKVFDKNKYVAFLIEQKRELRLFPSWEKHDFIHFIFFEDGEDGLFDMLYWENFQQTINQLREAKIKNKRLNDGRIIVEGITMYPTEIISNQEWINAMGITNREDMDAYITHLKKSA